MHAHLKCSRHWSDTAVQAAVVRFERRFQRHRIAEFPQSEFSDGQRFVCGLNEEFDKNARPVPWRIKNLVFSAAAEQSVGVSGEIAVAEFLPVSLLPEIPVEIKRLRPADGNFGAPAAGTGQHGKSAVVVIQPHQNFQSGMRIHGEGPACDIALPLPEPFRKRFPGIMEGVPVGRDINHLGRRNLIGARGGQARRRQIMIRPENDARIGFMAPAEFQRRVPVRSFSGNHVFRKERIVDSVLGSDLPDRAFLKRSAGQNFPLPVYGIRIQICGSFSLRAENEAVFPAYFRRRGEGTEAPCQRAEDMIPRGEIQIQRIEAVTVQRARLRSAQQFPPVQEKQIYRVSGDMDPDGELPVEMKSVAVCRQMRILFFRIGNPLCMPETAFRPERLIGRSASLREKRNIVYQRLLHGSLFPFLFSPCIRKWPFPLNFILFRQRQYTVFSRNIH